MRAGHTCVLLLGLGLVAGVALWRALPPALERPRPCRHPRAVTRGGRVLVTCGRGPGPAPAATAPGRLPATIRLTLGLRLDLNRATAAELRALPRIGPGLSRRIVDDRRRRGPFSRVEELARVRGIGPATVRAVRELVQVSGGSRGGGGDAGCGP
jgi:competence protein ComEA